MRKKAVFIAIFSAVILSGCSLLPGFLQRQQAAIQITTNPNAAVFLNDEKVGETPFKSQELKSQDYNVRLVPDGEGLIEWETTVKLYPGITTVITYDFAQDRQEASGATLTLEPLATSDAVEIAVISIPDNASVKLDGQPKGFTPLQVKNVEEGEHTLSVSAPGYKQRQIQIKTVSGHKLTVDVQLAREPIAQASPSGEEKPEAEDDESPKPTPEESKPASPSAKVDKPYIEILETPTGWLRVRKEPTTAADNEVAKVNPGERYSYLDTNESGWHKILLSDGQEGWISGRYAKLVK